MAGAGVFRRQRLLQAQLWDNAKDLASAYQIGRAEAAASMALLKEIDERVVSELTRMVKRPGCLWSGVPVFIRSYTLSRFLTHDAIGQGIFNRSTCTAQAAESEWQEVLTNSEPVLALLLERMEDDYCALNVKQRKAYGYKEVESRLNPLERLNLGLRSFSSEAARCSWRLWVNSAAASPRSLSRERRPQFSKRSLSCCSRTGVLVCGAGSD